ncbi:uncharacterized protein PAC_15884 [Phialocephala subalpina]|uniref:Heterokaryon incompatibility domain-containing protein n=1 Tax=Phialocephala subalpina TaxID=576137 RepID=A0A1L7XLV1_9HELO|nr:uncharacterized protein PAC_15884 [Phialocephala subalpina]
MGPFQQARQNRHRYPLLVTLNGTLHLCSSDPRDKIYGLLGVSGDDDAPSPDYCKPVRDVYTDFLSRKLRNGRNSVILLLSGSGGLEVSDRTPDLPSWVCDWHAWSQRNYRPVFWYQRLCYKADANSESTISIGPGSDTLRTKAVFLGRISVREGSGFDRRISFWDRFLPSNSPTAKYPTGVQPLQAALRTILADNDRKEMKRLGSDQDLFVELVVGFFLSLGIMSRQRMR